MTDEQICEAINEHADLKARLADANRGAQVNALVNESLAKKLKLAVEALEAYAYDAFMCRCNCGGDHLGEPCRLDIYLRGNGETIARNALAKIKEPSKGGEQR